MRKYIENARQPKGLRGRMILRRMNRSHAALSEWGLGFLDCREAEAILDVGCGGGANLARLLHAAPRAHVFGMDYSSVSVAQSAKRNRAAVREGRCTVSQGTVSALPFDRETFDLVTAFETVYFWPDLPNDLWEVSRVLKPGGRFLICNEAFFSPDAPERYAALEQALSMKVYASEELTEALSAAGFSQALAHTHENGLWIAVVAVK